MNTQEELAYALAKHAHAGQKYGDHDYFEYHVLGVANQFDHLCYYETTRDKNNSVRMKCKKCGHDGLKYQDRCAGYDSKAYIVALLHDVVEDSHISMLTIENLFTEGIRNSVNAMSNIYDDTYEEYISYLSRNKTAIKVKIADLKFHLSQPEVRHKERYTKALRLLEESL